METSNIYMSNIWEQMGCPAPFPKGMFPLSQPCGWTINKMGSRLPSQLPWL